MDKIISFEASAKEKILNFFDKEIDNEGYVVEKKDPSQRVLSIDGDPFTLDNFAGVRKGSEIFIKSDLNSLIALADFLK